MGFLFAPLLLINISIFVRRLLLLLVCSFCVISVASPVRLPRPNINIFQFSLEIICGFSVVFT
jgi:hypothetical protein